MKNLIHFVLNNAMFAPVLLGLAALIAHPFHINPMYVFAPAMTVAAAIFGFYAYEAR